MPSWYADQIRRDQLQSVCKLSVFAINQRNHQTYTNNLVYMKGTLCTIPQAHPQAFNSQERGAGTIAKNEITNLSTLTCCLPSRRSN